MSDRRETSITLSRDELDRFLQAKEKDGLEELPNGAYLVRILDERAKARQYP